MTVYSSLEQYSKKFHIWWVGQDGDQSFAMMCRICKDDWAKVYASPVEMIEEKEVVRHSMWHSDAEWERAWDN
jgi:hypothetical protein